jgi:hypothetical protein
MGIRLGGAEFDKLGRSLVRRDVQTDRKGRRHIDTQAERPSNLKNANQNEKNNGSDPLGS